jgi:hypothetical protein
MYTHSLAIDSYQLQNQISTNYYTYYESSDSSRSPVMSHNTNLYNTMSSYGFKEDMDMSDDRLNDSLLGIHNMDTFARPPVNRGGRKQVKVGTTKRNTRERNRVRYINNCFEVLREHIPADMIETDKNQKLSKVETLKYATIYIQRLAELLENDKSKGNNFPEVGVKKERLLKKAEPCENKKPKALVANCNSSSTIAYNNININVYENRNNGSISPAYSSTSPCSTGSSTSLSDCTNRYYSQELSPSSSYNHMPTAQQSNVYGSYDGFYNRW